MTRNARIGAALVGGYLLGRTKKARLAIGFGMFLAGRKLPLDPQRLGKMLAGSPVLGALNDQVRKEIVEATRSAATGALTQRATGLADALQRRTRELEDPKARDEDDDEPLDEEPADDEPADDEEPDDGHRDERDEDGEGDGKPASRRKQSTGSSGSSGRPAAKARAKTKSSAESTGRAASRPRRTASGGAAGKKTAGTARKAASGARKSTSSAARKTRGGDDRG
ncbi:hypothetical protein CP967_01340 [Streptomyces nitrosporeus]|uniref:DNA primase n=1 Tax=Streptomyces nitrosporeus TaxID=28894 RepID=A0A5J6F363_9ACTN|nr:hypothetical protein [Streptomyces nitrosporeus]QEU70778.1 hypothetical protein CP967_01340 [Streptomyces nitrosporeus]GGZ24452.1 hypothetical protein GCM10010327_64040 [Streptomyces nitrosporeus]